MFSSMETYKDCVPLKRGLPVELIKIAREDFKFSLCNNTYK